MRNFGISSLCRDAQLVFHKDIRRQDIDHLDCLEGHFCLEGQMKIWLLSQRKFQVWVEIARTHFVYSGSMQILLVEADSSAPYSLGGMVFSKVSSIYPFWIFFVCRTWFRIVEASTSYAD